MNKNIEKMQEIRNYAEKVIENIEGAEIQLAHKNNDVLKIGIIIRNGKQACPTVYVEDYYNRGIDPVEAALEIKNLIDTHQINIDVDFVKDYDKVRPLLKARLLNKKNRHYAGLSAKSYGYDDLKIVPVIDCSGIGVEGAIVVKPEMIKKWKKDIRTVVKHALMNMEDDYIMEPMYKFIGTRTGMPEELCEIMMSEFMQVISINNYMYGAIGAILAQDYLKENYKNGYVVLPSSVHEVIVIPNDNLNIDEYTNMVQAVNADCVDEIDQLSDKAYIIAA